jgi:hypothetical protein
MKPSHEDLVEEVDTLASALEGARMLAEMAETQEEVRAKVVVAVSAVLTIVVGRLMEVARRLNG